MNSICVEMDTRYDLLKAAHVRNIKEYNEKFEKLLPHLEEIDIACRERLEIIEKSMMQQEGVTEALKAADQMAWVRSMNSIHNRAEEIVLAELVYC